MTYRPASFRVDDRDTLLRFIQVCPLATFVTSSAGAVYLTHVPLLARLENDRLLLEGHIARANDQWRASSTDAAALFRIADHYISPSWYPARHADPRTVPTWDYVVVEARGNVRFIHDADWLLAFVRRFTENQEETVGGAWTVDEAPRDYLDAQLNAIVGIEMTVESLTGTFKLSQNHPAQNVQGVIDGLTALHTRRADALAELIAYRKY